MRKIIPAFSVLLFACIGCSNSSHNRNLIDDDYADTLSVSAAISADIDIIAADSVENDSCKSDDYSDDEDTYQEYENPIDADSLLRPFKVVIDTLNKANHHLVRSRYYLQDITGNGKPELWVLQGTCEADIDLWIYTCENGKVRKILSDYGGHTDFIFKGDTISSVTCNTGSGYVSVYKYINGRVKVESTRFNTHNEKGEARPKDKKFLPILQLWWHPDNITEFKRLK